MITRIILENYMSHASTVLHLARGLTVLLGPNNCGKSAVVSALQTLRGDNDGDFMVRHGAATCRVTVESDDGPAITWQRLKSTPSYVIGDKPVHRIGRGNLPDELPALLRLSEVEPTNCDESVDVHFGSQKSPIFLIDNPRLTAAFFSTSSDAERLLDIQKRHRQKVTDRKREHRDTVADIANLDRMLAALAPLDDIEQELRLADQQHQAILDADSAAQELADRIDEIQRQEMVVAHHAARCTALATLQLPPELEETAPLEKSLEDLTLTHARVQKLDSTVAALARLDAPPALVDALPLEEAVARLAEAHRRLASARARLLALANLQDPPPLADDASLEKLCREFALLGRKARHFGARVSALAKLAEPPAPHDTAALDDVLQRLQAAQVALDAATRRVEATKSLAEPPAQDDPAPLQQLIDQAAGVAAACTRHRAAIEELDAQIAALADQIADWVRQNPTCPTCGAPTSAQSILAGGHAHA